jgi:hypothetical protein
MSSRQQRLAPPKNWTAAELRRLPFAERDKILQEQAALAEQEYRTNRELTDFETFEEECGHGGPASATEG